MTHRILVLGVAAFTAASAIAFAQGPTRPGSTTGGTTGTGAGTITTTPGTGRPGTTSTTTLPGTTQQSPFPDTPRPIYVSGKVILADGSGAPDEPVMIERVCNGRPINEGYTNRKGHFNLELGRNQTMFMDASSDTSGGFNTAGRAAVSGRGMGSNGVSERSLYGCELRASLPGYRSSTISLSGRRFLDSPEVGTIILKRLGNVEGLTVSATGLNAPKDARKAYDKGHEALGKNKLDDAAKQLDRAVELYPRYAQAWFDRGLVHEARNDVDGARKAYAEALKADPKLLQPYERLASMDMQSGQWQDAADTSERLIRLDPFDYPQAYLINAIANLNLEKLENAEKSAQELLRNDTDHRFPKGEHVMAIILAKRQDWEDSAKHFRAYLQLAGPGASTDLARKQLAEVEKTLAAQQR